RSTMSPSRLAITAALSVFAAAAGGCSHEQKTQTAPRPVAQAPAPRPDPKPAAKPAEEVAEAPKPKEDPSVYFDFDSSLLKDDGRQVLQTIADAIRKRNASLAIEGNCDELGTVEYNLA